MKGGLGCLCPLEFESNNNNGFLVAPVPVQKNHITPHGTGSVVPGGESRPFGSSASATPHGTMPFTQAPHCSTYSMY